MHLLLRLKVEHVYKLGLLYEGSIPEIDNRKACQKGIPVHSDCDDLAILGGGASGISVGYYANRSGLGFRIFEATDSIGGNAATIRFKDFLFDTGAHRWHDRHPDITAELKNMMGAELKKIHMPSHIFCNKKSIDFPLSPLNLLKTIGPVSFAKSGVEVLINRMFNGHEPQNFEDFAVGTYGRTIAEKFLINYSEKLWGRPCRELSPRVAGKRMKGLNLRTFFKEALLGEKAKTEHLDGAFYYPTHGIGDILEKWAEECGMKNIARCSEITRIFHDGKKLLSLEVNGRDTVKVGHVVNTLPVTLFLKMLSPSPPEDIMAAARALRYRHVRLVALFIDKPSVTRSATVYFPEKEFVFTRLYEPKNRSGDMAPEAQTSLVAEIPCREGSEYWEMEDASLIERVSSKLTEIGWLQKEDILDAMVHTMNNAYPVFEAGYEEKMGLLGKYFKRFENLQAAGRNGRFEYLHLHDSMKSGKEIVETFKKSVMGQ
jgi:protoporphyrinogen oxidase